MVLTRSRQRKDVKATDDKPRKSSKKDEDSVTQSISLKTQEAKPKQSEQTSAITANEEVKPQPDSTESFPPGPQDVGKDAVVIATTEDGPSKKKSRKQRYRKRKSLDAEIKSQKSETESQSEVKNQDVSTKSNAKGEKMTVSSPSASSSSSSTVKQKSDNNTSSKNETVSCVKRAKKDERTAVDEDLQKENVNSTLDLEKGEPLTEEKTEVVNTKGKDIMKLYKKESFIGEVTKYKGNPKSGRKWKTEQTSRSSGMKQDKPMRSSWKKKMNVKAEKKSMKLFEAELKETKSKELEKKKQHRANKIKLKLENERKSEVVQVIKNPAKLKRMKKKQLRKVEMRKIPNFNTAQIFA